MARISRKKIHFSDIKESEFLEQEKVSEHKAEANKNLILPKKIPYGMKKSKKNRNLAEIEEETAFVVRKIFEWKMAGCSRTAIADNLNILGIPSPMQRIILKKEGYPQAVYFWKERTISYLLQNKSYLGNQIFPRVISENCFEAVNKKIQKEKEQWRKEHYNQRKKTEEKLKGLVFCGYCDKKLVRVREKQNKDKTKFRYYYRCPSLKQGKVSNCKLKKRVREDYLMKKVWQAIEEKEGGVKKNERK